MPDYVQLVRFLVQPFLTSTEAIGVDCEYTLDRQRVWIRVAVPSSDRDTAFGRGGRNIQAIKAVIQAAATTVGQSIHLDVYGSNFSRDRDADRGADRSDERNSRRPSGDRPSGSRPPRSMPTRRSASNGEDRSSSGGGDSPSLPPPRPRR
jgi:uncharacterized protein